MSEMRRGRSGQTCKVLKHICRTQEWGSSEGIGLHEQYTQGHWFGSGYGGETVGEWYGSVTGVGKLAQPPTLCLQRGNTCVYTVVYGSNESRQTTLMYVSSVMHLVGVV